MGQQKRACTAPRKLSPNANKHTKRAIAICLKQSTQTANAKANREASFWEENANILDIFLSVLHTSEPLQYMSKGCKKQAKNVMGQVPKRKD